MALASVWLQAALALPALAAQEAAGASPVPELAIVEVSVVPLDGAPVLEHRTVIIRGGLIAALGASAELAVPSGALEIDGRGRYLLPGLADMHVHVWDERDLFLFVANGVTTVRNMFGSPQHLEWRRRIEAGELVGPQLYTAGPIIDGTPPVWPGSTVLTDPAAAAGVVREQRAAGYDFLKPYARLSSDCYDALAAAAREQGLRLMGHVPEAIDLEHALAQGQATIEHLDGWAEAARAGDSPPGEKISFRNEHLAWEHLDPELEARLARRVREAGAWCCPTLVVLQKWVQGDGATELLARPEMRYASPILRAAWAPESPWNYLKNLPEDLVAGVRGSVERRKLAVRALRDAGAGILAGTDMGNPYVLPGFALHEELANLVAAGLTPCEALRAASANAAECMQASDRWGTIAAGRRADLILVEANPLADVANAARRAGVVLHGRWYPEDELRAELERRAQELAPPPGETAPK